MLPVRSYSVRMKRRNREAAASFRRNQSRRKATTTTTTASSHAPVRKTVSAGAVPSENKPTRSPSTKSVSSEPEASTSKDLKFETLVEEQEEKESGKEEEDEAKDKTEVVKEYSGDTKEKEIESECVAEKEEAPIEKAHVTFQEPEEEEEERELKT